MCDSYDGFDQGPRPGSDESPLSITEQNEVKVILNVHGLVGEAEIVRRLTCFLNRRLERLADLWSDDLMIIRTYDANHPRGTFDWS